MLSPAIACLTETWLDKSVNDSANFIGNPYCVIVRSDRTHGHHGGIFIAFHNNFLKDIEIKCSAKSENDCVVLLTYASLTLYVVLFYLPLRVSQFYVKPIVAELRNRAIMSEVENKLQLRSSDSIQWLILGGFNYPNVQWECMTSAHSDEQTLLEFIAEQFFLPK